MFSLWWPLGAPRGLFRGYQVDADGMALGMAMTMKVTLPVESEEAIRRLVADGRADSVYGFVQHAVQVSLDDVTGWGGCSARRSRTPGKG